MKFRTELLAPKYPFKITLSDKILLIGSCFSENIACFLKNGGFQVLNNPFGTLFNPYSIATTIKIAANTSLFTENYIYKFNEQWISFAHYTKFSNSNYDIFIENINSQIQIANNWLKDTSVVFITFGTAFCYKFIERGIIVSNCHKIPNNSFLKIKLSIDEIVLLYKNIVKILTKINPNIKIIFTVSPIRHYSNNIHENSISKSILHIATDVLVDNKTTYYFPAYEFICDDLRDYRYYNDDLVHPNSQAIKYIEEKFIDSFLLDNTKADIIKNISKFKKMAHIPVQKQ